jgi:hypothetical protein
VPGTRIDFLATGHSLRMTEDPKPEATPPGDPAPVPDTPPAAEPEAGRTVGAREQPSEDATADIEERQDTQRAEERKNGRPPADAPSY